MAGVNATAWKADNYRFVGKAFNFAYADRLNKLAPILGEVNCKSSDYELVGAGGYGELLPYDGENLNFVSQKRGFKTIITPHEFTASDRIGRKQARVDKLGETDKVGSRLGDAAAVSVYMHALRLFSHAADPRYLGGDGKPWAAEDHPVAAMMDEGRRRIPDPDSGTFSNYIHIPFNVENIGKAQVMASEFVTPDGIPFLCDMDTVLIAPQLEPEAKKMFGENSKLRPTRNPDDNSNAANPVADMQYMVVGGGADGLRGRQWAICDRRMMKELVKLVYGCRPEVMQTELDNPLIDQYTAYVDFALGWGDARQIIFSDPK